MGPATLAVPNGIPILGSSLRSNRLLQWFTDSPILFAMNPYEKGDALEQAVGGIELASSKGPRLCGKQLPDSHDRTAAGRD